ncbi:MULTISPECIES: transaldolase [unclassified Halomonas]|uniref:transaldolase n=1 Tax=unclassified Halomonas TaxID=2609666 RepID=UPI00055014C3|nr:MULTISPECIES: transaldolase [unclassified Halomonas]MBR9905158.1 transaldolase [Gammaproteobacteria bacterium]CEP35070.1 Transaldolase [Halomonas sp. R57-5]
MSLLNGLREHSLVVADTGDLDAIKRYQPQDATTNPSLILNAFELPRYQEMIDRVLAESCRDESDPSRIVDQLSVAIGGQIANVIPGRISTEVSAHLSFDTQASIHKAYELIERYEKQGINRNRVLIKLASTWEGIRAAEQLEREGINCNLTLLFSDAQAQACFDAGVYLISPFVGRVSDWYQKTTGKQFTPEEDPGVLFVKGICERAAAGSYDTVVMGASFRTTDQVLALAGCHRLTISPALLEELNSMEGKVASKIQQTPVTPEPCKPLSEAGFRWQHNQDAMANELLADGIRRFASDQQTLESLIAQRLTARA